MSLSADTMGHVVFRLKQELYALPAGLVEQMIEMPPITRVPGTPPSCRGVVNLRGRVVPVHDLRVLLGMEPVRAELAAMDLPRRWQDHLDWASELRASVAEGRAFGLTTDPHSCRFGKWYDTFRTNDAWLRALLSEFDAPHQQLHATADVVASHRAAGRQDLVDVALTELEDGPLAALAGLFAKAIDAVAAYYRETAMVLRRGAELLAFSTDQVIAVEEVKLVDADRQLEFGGAAAELVKGFGRRTDGAVVMMLDASDESPLLRV